MATHRPIARRDTRAPARHQPTGTELTTSYERRDARERLTHCPETGIDLDTVDIAKHILNKWPTINQRDLPDTEAGRRIALLLEEYHKRQEEAQQTDTDAEPT